MNNSLTKVPIKKVIDEALFTGCYWESGTYKYPAHNKEFLLDGKRYTAIYNFPELMHDICCLHSVSDYGSIFELNADWGCPDRVLDEKGYEVEFDPEGSKPDWLYITREAVKGLGGMKMDEKKKRAYERIQRVLRWSGL